MHKIHVTDILELIYDVLGKFLNGMIYNHNVNNQVMCLTLMIWIPGSTNKVTCYIDEQHSSFPYHKTISQDSNKIVNS